MEKSVSNEGKKYQLQTDIKTSISKSEGLYDFKTNDCTQKIDESDEAYYFIRKQNDYTTKKDNQLDINFENDAILFRTRKSKKNDNQYEIINPVIKNLKKNKENINNLDNKAWLVIDSESDYCQDENENYILNENDIIKLGVKKFEVIEKNINISKDEDTVNKNDCYNISQMNKLKGNIFDISIEKSQYKITENKNKVKNDELIENENKESDNNKERCFICFDYESTPCPNK